GRQRVLLTFSDTAGTDPAQVNQPRAAGLVALRLRALPCRAGTRPACRGQALSYRQLIHRQLGMSLRVVLADRCLAGLDVDNYQPAGGVAFDPIDSAPQPPIYAGALPVEAPVDVALHAALGQLTAGLSPPIEESLNHRSVPSQLVS